MGVVTTIRVNISGSAPMHCSIWEGLNMTWFWNHYRHTILSRDWLSSPNHSCRWLGTQWHTHALGLSSGLKGWTVGCCMLYTRWGGLGLPLIHCCDIKHLVAYKIMRTIPATPAAVPALVPVLKQACCDLRVKSCNMWDRQRYHGWIQDLRKEGAWTDNNARPHPPHLLYVLLKKEGTSPPASRHTIQVLFGGCSPSLHSGAIQGQI
jgi:hypothetical protein